MSATPPPEPGDIPPPRSGGRAGRSWGATAAARLSQFAHTSAPWLREFGLAFGDWLATVSWGKFIFLLVLLFIFSEKMSSLLFSAKDAGRELDQGSISVEVHIVPLPDGRLYIDSADPPKKAAGNKDRGLKERGLTLQIDKDAAPANPASGGDSPVVSIDNQGVRIVGDDAGRKVAVIINHDGVHVQKLASDPTPAPAAAGAPAPAAPPAYPADPQKVASAVEAARSRIESLLQEHVDRRLQALHGEERAERGSWIVALTSLAIVAMIALKVVLGSKSRAEFQARRASATAAQEGLKRQLAEAQLKMMQAQVEPHFLFNTLASVDYLIETDPARASRMQKNLIQYLRAALPQMRAGSSTLGREIALCRSYLEILKVRMDERLQFSLHVPQGLLTASFPPMMLLTLVENAIKHGLEPKAEGGSLSVSAVVADARLRVAVADSGMGFGVAQRGGTGVGLVNVRERLQALYGSGASLDIDANSDGGTIASIQVPYRIEPVAPAPAEGAGTPAAAV